MINGDTWSASYSSTTHLKKDHTSERCSEPLLKYFSLIQYAGAPPAGIVIVIWQFFTGQRKFSVFVFASNDSRNIAYLCS